MKKTGEILKKAREEKGLSLNEVGLSLKISSKVLKAIEEGDEKNLPAKTFLRGFVKSYATYLRLDADKVLETFYEEFGSTRPQPYIRQGEHKEVVEEKHSEPVAPVAEPETTSESEPTATVTPIRHTRPEPVVQAAPTAAPQTSRAQPYNPLNEKKNTKTIAVVVVLAVLVGLIIFTKKMIDKYSKEAEVPTSQVAQTMEGATPVATVSATPGATESPAPVESMTPPAATGAEATPAPSPLSSLTKTAHTPVPATMATPSASPSATPVTAAPSPAAKPTPSATPAEKKAEDATAATSATEAKATPTPSPTPKEEKNKPVELIVEALDTVDIEYSAPNGKPQKIKLSAEQVHTFKSRSGLRISFSNGGAVNLIVNGKDVGIPGDLGKPIKLSY